MVSFGFQWFWFILLLPLPLLVWLLWPTVQPHRSSTETQLALVHPTLGRLEHAYTATVAGASALGFLPTLLWGLLWFALVATMMRPQWLHEHTEIKNRGYDLMLAVDLSRSMLSSDFTVDGQRVNRLQVVKGVLGRFIERRQGDRIGLILFGDSAYMQAPLTLDGNAVQKMLYDTVPGIAGDATAIGDAIGLAVKKLRERPLESRVLILLTDGANTAGSLPPDQAALLASQFQVRIYTIGVGTMGEVSVPDIEVMKIDEDLLRRVAEYTGGAYFRATDTQALEHVYEQINTLEKTEAESQTVIIPEPLYHWPLGVALLILLLLAGLDMMRGRF